MTFVLLSVIVIQAITIAIGLGWIRYQHEDSEEAFRHGRREGISHYKDIWTIVEEDWRRHHE